MFVREINIQARRCHKSVYCSLWSFVDDAIRITVAELSTAKSIQATTFRNSRMLQNTEIDTMERA